ncbi:protein tyrosine phosphatase family protein [Ruegeria arenilitoris]|uniref:protein tyrosine phosphatase family protein n=1 Tax=Ruegeria arenilitoris TaxID=1173585 RepID=UPI00147B8539|nr:protein tyrosine phosphatase family protein [Ruegeria arenilitoris]
MTSLTDILNFRRVDDRLTLSGQPTEEQIAALAGAGIADIVNLGPHDNKGALADEPGTVAAAGMTYHYIPVDFEKPTENDYSAFVKTLDSLGDTPVHVHCIYNARVSAFMLRRARDGSGDVAAAEALMDGIWRPGGVWAAFLGHEADIDKPNRYLGYEY